MKVLILSDDYLPDSTRNHAKMMHELGREYVSLGHDVYVITPGSKDQSSRLYVEIIDGVNVWRFKSSKFRDLGLIRRGIGELLLSLRAFLALRELKKIPHFDICINYSPSIFFSPLAAFFRSKNTFIYLVLRDFFPQWLVDERIISKFSPLWLFFRCFEKLNYKVADVIALQSRANISVFSKIYNDPAKISILMNWAVNEQTVQTDCTSIRKSLKLDDKVIFFYGGNIGHAQDMKNLVKLVRDMLPFKNAHFLFVGQGDEYCLVEEYKSHHKLSNLTIMPSVDQETYKAMLCEVDVGLFSLSPNHTAHNFPGKLLGYMVESLPILGSVNSGNDLMEIVNPSGAGYVSINGDRNQLKLDAVSLLNKETRESMGQASNQLLENKFSVKHAAAEIIEKFNKWDH